MESGRFFVRFLLFELLYHFKGGFPLILDMHTHAFPDAIAAKALPKLAAICGCPYQTDGTLAGTQAKMKEWGVDAFALMHIATTPTQHTSVNNWAASIQQKNVICFGSVHPNAENPVAEIQRIHSLGLHGIKFHPDYQEFLVDDPRLFPLYEEAASLHLPVTFHTGRDPLSPSLIHAPAEKVAKVADLFPTLTIIAAHMGGMDTPDEAEAFLLGKPNVYLDTAFASHFLAPDRCERMIRKHSLDRVLFASDSPWSRSCDEKKFLERCGFSSRELDQLLGGNACALLGIS